MCSEVIGAASTLQMLAVGSVTSFTVLLSKSHFLIIELTRVLHPVTFKSNLSSCIKHNSIKAGAFAMVKQAYNITTCSYYISQTTNLPILNTFVKPCELRKIICKEKIL